MSLPFASFEDAVVVDLIRRWRAVTSRPIGRTALQKLCYFVRARGVPIGYAFEMYHYGPFSYDLYLRVPELEVEDIIRDVSRDPDRSDYALGPKAEVLLRSFADELSPYSDALRAVVQMFESLPPRILELLSTTHYVYRSLAEFHRTTPEPDTVVQKVYAIKEGKFSREDIKRAFKALEAAGLLEWAGP